MQSSFIFKLFFLCLFLMVDLFAVEGNIKLFIKEHKALYTSQKITVSVVLMTDAFSISEARINFPSSSNYIVQEPKSAAFLNQEEIDGVAWQQVHYEYDVYALRAGKVEIPPMNISFSGSMGYGQEKKAFEFKSEVLSFQVEAPKGIENNRFVLVTNKYTLASDLKPKKKQLIVGDAVEFSISQKAHGIPDILLKPFVYRSSNKIRVYDKEPELKSGLKGDLDVSRTDRFTFVASAEGNVTIASQETVWWNSTTKKVQKESIAEMTFEIIADPQIALDAQKAKEKKFVLIVGIIILILLLLYHFASPAVKKYLKGRKLRYEKSEKGKFEQLIQSVEEGNISKIYSHFYAWLATVDHSIPLLSFKDVYAHYPEFKDQFITFESLLISHNDLNKSSACNTLKELRTALLKDTTMDSYALETRLNP